MSASSSIPRGILRDAGIVIAGIIIVWAGLYAAFGMPNPFYVVASGSMVPELEIYDVLIVQGNHPFDELRIGDVIVFDRPSDHNRVIVHRVANVIDDDPRTLRTKGDANRASIPGTDFPITEKEYIGKVEHVIPQIGYVTQALKPPVNYIIIAVIIGVMISKQLLARKKGDDKAVFSGAARDGEDGAGDDVIGDDTDTDKRDADGLQADAPGRDGAAPDAGQGGTDGPAVSGYNGDPEYVEDGPQEKGGDPDMWRTGRRRKAATPNMWRTGRRRKAATPNMWRTGRRRKAATPNMWRTGRRRKAATPNMWRTGRRRKAATPNMWRTGRRRKAARSPKVRVTGPDGTRATMPPRRDGAR